MANFFDQFDEAPAKAGGNFFDQFDAEPNYFDQFDEAEPANTASDKGFLGRRGEDVKRGFARLRSTGDVISINDAVTDLRLMDLVDEQGIEDYQTLEKASQQARISPNPRQIESYLSKTPEQKKAFRKKRIQQVTDNVADLAARNKEAAEIPVSEARQAFNQSEGFGEAFDAFLDSPMEVASSLSTESLVQFAPALPFLFTGPAGAAMASGGTSLANEYAGDIIGSMQEAGIDTQSPEAIQAALTDPEQVEKWKDRASKRAVPIALIDALSAGVGGRFVEMAKSPAKKAMAAGGEALALQPVLGGSGEVAGSLAVGDEIEGRDVLAEMIGELGPGTVETAAGIYRSARDARAAGQQQEGGRSLNHLLGEFQETEADAGPASTPDTAPFDADQIAALERVVEQDQIQAGTIEDDSGQTRTIEDVAETVTSTATVDDAIAAANAVVDEQPAPVGAEAFQFGEEGVSLAADPLAARLDEFAPTTVAVPPRPDEDTTPELMATEGGNFFDQFDAEPVQQAPPSIEGESIDSEWARFNPESGTLNIPRSEMPQIKAEHRGAMVNFLNARGIEHQEETIPAADLKPTQAEFSREKVAKAKEFTGGDRSILVSADNHVVDGHHQWMAKREAGEDVKVIRLDAPIQELLPVAAEFPSAEVDGGKGQGRPESFVASPDGATDFGQIDTELGSAIRRQPGPIRLEKGDKKYGLEHIKLRHGKQLENLGYTPESFTEEVAREFNAVYRAPAGQLVLAKRNGRDHIMFVELRPSEDGDYYRVNTAYPVEKRTLRNHLKKEKLVALWEGIEPTSEPSSEAPAFAHPSEGVAGAEGPSVSRQGAELPQDRDNARSVRQQPSDKQEAVDETPDDDPLLRASYAKTGAKPTGMTPRSAKLVVDSFLKKYKGADDGLQIRVHQRQDELITALNIDETRRTIGRVKGAFVPRDNTLHLVAANLAGPADVRHTIQHEILVHKGLGFLPLEQRTRLIKSIAENAPKSPALKKAWAKIERDYAGDSDYRKAEELLARMAERTLSTMDRYLQKILNVLKSIFVKYGLMDPGLRKEELIETVYRFGDAFAEGKQAGLRAPKEARMSQNNEWNDFEYDRVMPRDLFNEAKVLSMHLKLIDDYNKGLLPKGFEVSVDESLRVGLTENGELFLGGLEASYNGEPVALHVPYNSGKENKFPLQATAEELDVWSATVYTESGGLDSDFSEAFGEVTAKPKSKIELSDTFENSKNFMVQLGAVGLWEADGMLPRNMEFELHEPSEGFVLSDDGTEVVSQNLNASLNGEPVEFFLDLDDGKLKFRHDGDKGVVLSGREMHDDFKNLIGRSPDTLDPDDPNADEPLLSQSVGFDGWTPPNAALGIISDKLKSKAGLKQRLRATRRKLQDKHVAWQDVQKEIAKRGGSIDDFSDAYNKFTLIEGKIGDKFRTLADKHVKPLVDELTKSDITVAQLGDYLYAHFAPQRNARIAEINPGLSDGGSGLTNAEAKQILDGFTPEQTATLERMAQHVYAMQRFKLDELVKSGRITDALRTELLKDDRYVPLKGYADASDLVSDTAAVGRGFDQAQDVFKRAKGRTTMAAEIVATSIRDVEAGIISAEKNRVGQSVLKLVAENPNKDLWEINPIKVQRAFNSRTGQVEQRVVGNYKALARDPNVFITWVDGKPFAIEFKDNPGGESALARAVKNMGVDNVPWFIGYLSGLNRYLSYMNTALSPEFILTNPIRDVQTGLAKAYGDYDAKTAKSMAKNLPRAFRAATHVFADSKLAKGAAKKAGLTDAEIGWAREYMAEGGKTDYFRTKTVDQMKSQLESELSAAAKGVKGAAIRTFKAGYQLVENGNAVLENTTRLSIYMTLREQGVSKHKAAVAAKNATVNFNRKGESGVLFNSLYLFYNASMQGTHLTLKLMKNPKIQKLLVGAGVGMIVLTQYNILAGGDDEDGEPNYFKLPDYEKERNLIFMWPDGSGRYSKIPLPYGLNVPLNAAAALAHVANGQKPMKQALWVGASAWNSFSPVGESGWNIIAPTVADPFVDISLNRNFMDSNIMPDRNPYERSETPDSQRAFHSTHPLFKKAAETVNELTGGDKQKAGYVDISPESIEHLVETYTGAAGGFVMRMTTWATDPEMETARKPFIRKFYGEKSPYEVGSSYRDRKAHVFYLEERLESLQAQARESQEDRNYYLRWRTDNREGLRLVNGLKTTESSLRKLYERRKSARDRGDDEQVERIEDRIRREQARFNQRYNEVYLDTGIAEKFDLLIK